MHEPDADAATRADFNTWLAEDPLHGEAYERLSQTLDKVKAHAPGVDAYFDHKEEREGSRRSVAIGALALAGACLGTGLVANTFDETTHATAVGEQRIITLRDGTKVNLNTDTRLLVRASQGARRVQLANGEAVFEVARNPSLHFVADARGHAVISQDAHFAIRTNAEGFCVLVIRGAVDIDEAHVLPWPRPRNEITPLRLVAGQRYKFSESGTDVAPIPSAEIERLLTWRTGWLEFSGQPLVAAASEVVRYSNARFFIEDPSLQQLPVVARFRSNDLDAFLFSLETGFPLVDIRRDGNDISITRRTGTRD